ncbi:putative transcription factor bHLH041 [Mercurialis annua]|uniref:putative transcription factor bHLH041 n=1 Tax=Mercurialis annua TaxID=3986 RepID=UPI00215F1FD7|nr:putative transcription factor bHLH041 [Mercurialis annua]
MDTVFSLIDEVERANYLQSLLNSSGCTYICLWLYYPQPDHRLYFWDGRFNEENNQPGLSSGSVTRRLFDAYRREVFYVLNDRIPGMAFLNSQLPYRELNQSELLRLSSVAVQRQFYQEASIKSAVFMGCRSGEIEMGWSNSNQINMEHATMSWFSEYNFHHNNQSHQLRELSQSIDPNRPSSSSSSLRSLESPESSSLMFNIPTTSEIPITPNVIQQVLQSLNPIPVSAHQQAMQAFALSRNAQLPTQESEEAVMTRAILAVLTSPSSSAASSSTPNSLPYGLSQKRASAFEGYLAPKTPMRSASLGRISLLKRAITYYRSLNTVRREHMMANRPTTTQLHHMISERRRREKINESFEALRKLLPPEAKKDKASVLSRTREYLTLLKTQVKELSQRNQQLEAQLSPAARETHAEKVIPENQKLDISDETVDVRIQNVSESDEERIFNLQVCLRGECSVANLLTQILEFLKTVKQVNVTNIEANISGDESRSFSSRVILRLRIEGIEWDEVAFQEAVRRVVADLAQ